MTGSRSRRILPCVLFAGVMALTVSLERAQAAPASGPAVYELLKQFHSPDCAGSLCGARLGLAARQALTAAGGTGRFMARYYELSCPLDGIQSTTASASGNRQLTVSDRDEHRLILTASENKRQVEARLTDRAVAVGAKSLALNRKAAALPVGSPERQRLEAEIEARYAWLKTAPDAEVVTVTTVQMPQGKRRC